MRENAWVFVNSRLTDELFVLKVVPDTGVIPDYKPGQYVALGLPESAASSPADEPKMILRAYSIASAPRQKEALEFFIALVPTGALTPKLCALRSGDRIYVAPKITGRFTVDGIPDRVNIVLVATGTGLAPYLSMLREGVLWGAHRRVALIHGVRHVRDLGYREELEAFAASRADFDYLPVVSRPGESRLVWHGLQGRVQSLLTDDLLGNKWGTPVIPQNTHFFLCGNPAMVSSVSEDLARRGFVEHTGQAPGQIHIEKYW